MTRRSRARLTRPLSGEDVADCILYAVTRPPHVVVDELVLMSIDQSSGARVNRRS